MLSLTRKQVALDDMALLTMRSLMEVNDTKSVELATAALESLDIMLTLNDDIYVGNGVVPVALATPKVVRHVWW